MPVGLNPSRLVLDAATAAVRRAGLASDGEALYFGEYEADSRRSVLVRRGPEGSSIVVPPPGNGIGSKVHEYGGGAFDVDASGALVVVDQRSQDLFSVTPTGWSRRVSATADERWAHGDVRIVAQRRLVLAVRERPEQRVNRRELVAYGLGTSRTSTTLLSGRGFIHSPRPSPDGTQLAWLSWDEDQMSWDRSTLWVADLDTDRHGAPVLRRTQMVAGGEMAVAQPCWDAEGRLYFCCDAQDWFQPWVCELDGSVRRVSRVKAEFARPLWVFGESTLAAVAGQLLAVVRSQGIDQLVVVDPSGSIRELEQPCTAISTICAHGDQVALLGASLERSLDVYVRPPLPVPTAAPSQRGRTRVRITSEFFTFEGARSRPTYGRLYCHQDARGEAPLIVWCHGGPTTSVDVASQPVIDMLTRVGYAVAAVEYAGSSGFGRRYRQRLNGRYGLDDATDCVAAARHLAAAGWVPPGPYAVRGTSSGGMTALNAFIEDDDCALAVVWFPVVDLETMVGAGPDFEAHYFEHLVGPYPECARRYQARSPRGRLRADKVGELVVCHGDADPVVPLSQSESLVAEARALGLACEYLVLPGEGHGFRDPTHVRRALTTELNAYRRVLGLGAEKAHW